MDVREWQNRTMDQFIKKPIQMGFFIGNVFFILYCILDDKKNYNLLGIQKMKAQKHFYLKAANEQVGKKTALRIAKEEQVIRETIEFLEKRWKEEFPQTNMNKPIKPYVRAWCSLKLRGCLS